jgi:DNA-directed RNA polymerase sigma subunit (sigma70/sigma32)
MQTVNPEEVVEAAQLSERIMAALGTLTWKEEAVIQLRFGFGCKRCTLDQVGKMLGAISREQARKIEAVALRKLRHPKRSRGLYRAWRGTLPPEDEPRTRKPTHMVWVSTPRTDPLTEREQKN